MKRILCVLLLSLLFAFGAFANEEGGHHEQPPILYKWLNFGILMLALLYLAVKVGGPFFAGRKQEIAHALADAERIKIESEKQVAEINKRIANLDGELKNLREAARREMDSERERAQKDTEAMVAKLKAHAQDELDSAAKQAAAELKAFCSQLALELAQQKIRARLDAPTQGRLVSAFLADLKHAEKN